MSVDKDVSYDEMMDNMQNYNPKYKLEMSVEELLKPRYKVIAEMPVLPFKMGEIYNADFIPITIRGKQEYVRLDIYPHLFRKLEWWQERDEKDMPKYVQTDGMIFKVEKYEELITDDAVAIFPSGSVYAGVCLRANTEPATEAEYLNYIKL